MADFVLTRTGTQVDDVVTAGNNASATSSDTLLHSGNTGVVTFAGAALTGASDEINLGVDANNAILEVARPFTSLATMQRFINTNGIVGQITTNGTATAYVTSSDPRLKNFLSSPTDEEINSEFDLLYSCARIFTWKNDPDGSNVWGFDAHACIDAGLDVGVEGDGPRDLALGDIYDTTPAEVDEDDNEIKPAIDHKVSPAGVDQSKAVPILLAKIEQLERRLVAAGL